MAQCKIGKRVGRRRYAKAVKAYNAERAAQAGLRGTSAYDFPIVPEEHECAGYWVVWWEAHAEANDARIVLEALDAHEDTTAAALRDCLGIIT